MTAAFDVYIYIYIYIFDLQSTHTFLKDAVMFHQFLKVLDLSHRYQYPAWRKRCDLGAIAEQ